MSEKYEYKKRFHDLEKEESWLNEMAEKGLVLKNIKYGFFRDRYIFERCEKKYICRIDYNPEMEVMEEITSPYTMFVTGTYGTEFICCANGKLYFRKAEENGEFPPIYTSAESRLAAEKKKLFQYSVLTLLCIFDILFACTTLGRFLHLSFALPHFWLQAVALTIVIVCLGYCIKRVYLHSKKIAEIKKNTR